MTKAEAQSFERIMAKLAPVVAEAVVAETKTVETKPATQNGHKGRNGKGQFTKATPEVKAAPVTVTASSDLEITFNSPEDAETYGRPGDPAIMRVTRWIDTARKGRVPTKSMTLRVSELEAILAAYAGSNTPAAA